MCNSCKIGFYFMANIFDPIIKLKIDKFCKPQF